MAAPAPNASRARARGRETPAERALRERAGDCICGNLRMAARLVTAHYDAALRPCGIEANQMAMLWVVHAAGATPANEIAYAAGVDPSTASRNLAVLEQRGLVRVEPSREDRRQRVVSLTGEGRGTLLRAYPRWRKAQEEVGAMTADLADLHALGRTLRRIARRMQAGAAR